jgi:2,4-dienoyl-CoA reductase-like NADH-dependent reductase (Old Yellow Enzyme family)
VAWKRIVDFVHANSQAKFCLQLATSGRKGATRLMWECDVAYWHLADIPSCTAHVRFRG